MPYSPNTTRALGAVFFDRDDTMLHTDPARVQAAIRQLASLAGRDEDAVRAGYNDWQQDITARMQREWQTINTKDKERAFWQARFRDLLARLGRAAPTSADLEQTAGLLFYYKLYTPFADVVPCLRALSRHGLRLGVISDTFPLLRESLAYHGLARYFSAFTAACRVGYLKPSPEIYRHALAAMGVAPERAVYVDDKADEAAGARRLGMRAYVIDRSGRYPHADGIRSLAELTAEVVGLL